MTAAATTASTTASTAVEAVFIVFKNTGVFIHKVIDYCTAGRNKQNYGQKKTQR